MHVLGSAYSSRSRTLSIFVLPRPPPPPIISKWPQPIPNSNRNPIKDGKILSRRLDEALLDGSGDLVREQLQINMSSCEKAIFIVACWQLRQGDRRWLYIGITLA